MQVSSEDRTMSVRIRLLESEDRGVPSVKTAVDADFGGFTGSTTVWFERDALDAMINALGRLAVTRGGEAKVESMSPGEAMLSVTTLDRAGHLLFSASLLKHAWIRGKQVERRASGSFEIDPTALDALIDGLRALASGIDS